MWKRVKTISLIITTILFTFCEKEPTKLVDRASTDEMIYFSLEGGDRPHQEQIYVLDPNAGAVVDSIPMSPFAATYLAISPDGCALYASLEPLTLGRWHLYRIDLDSKKIFDLGLTNAREVYISPDGKYLITAGGHPNEGLILRDANDGTIVYQDLDVRRILALDPSQPIVYVSHRQDTTWFAIRYNYVEGRFLEPVRIEWRKIGMIIETAAISPESCYLYYCRGDAREFGVVDLKADSLIFRDSWLGIGDIGVKPDGSAVYITDFGTQSRWGQTDDRYPPLGKIGKYIPGQSKLSVAVDLYKTLPPWFGTMYFYVSSDGQRGYLSAGMHVIVLDLATDRVLKTIRVTFDSVIFHMVMRQNYYKIRKE